MSCTCIYVGDLDAPRLSFDVIRRASRKYRCCECREPIERGERYECASALWEGHWATDRTCLLCAEIRRALFCEGWIYGECWERIRETFRDGATFAGCLDEIPTAAAREKLAEVFRETVRACTRREGGKDGK